MFKRLTSLAILVFISSSYLFAQPSATLWRIIGEDHESNPPEFYECGEFYYFVGSEETVQTHWSIRNDGDETLVLALPLTLTAESSDHFSIIGQPTTASLAPSEEAHFSLQYARSEVDGQAYLTIDSNDPNHSECGLLLDGGDVSICFLDVPLAKNDIAKDLQEEYCPEECIQCICRQGKLEEICLNFWQANGIRASGIIQNFGPCPIGDIEMGMDFDCEAIKISDPCLCENLITNAAGTQIFRDTLKVTGAPGINLILSMNTSSFLDINENPIMAGMFLGVIPPNGIFQYVFYRQPGDVVNISVNGESFVSETCLEVIDCAIIPTMPQWALIVFSLILLSLGVVRIYHVRKIEV